MSSQWQWSRAAWEAQGTKVSLERVTADAMLMLEAAEVPVPVTVGSASQSWEFVYAIDWRSEGPTEPFESNGTATRPRCNLVARPLSPSGAPNQVYVIAMWTWQITLMQQETTRK
ncbi:hypothetical protein BM1_01253 [Bipolaris maydis]|nr:hypothetical protein BM1_01253 [Bipolaris maydis]